MATHLHRHFMVLALQWGGKVLQSPVLLQQRAVLGQDLSLVIILTHWRCTKGVIPHCKSMRASELCKASNNEPVITYIYRICWFICTMYVCIQSCTKSTQAISAYWLNMLWWLFREWSELRTRRRGCTCILDASAQVLDVGVQPIENAHHAGHGTLAELHAVLQLQAQLLLAAVVQRGQELLGSVAQRGRGRGRCGGNGLLRMFRICLVEIHAWLEALNLHDEWA